MSLFKKSAKFYDLLYTSKNYEKEAEYIHQAIQKYSSEKPLHILDMGCGTGGYDFFLSKYGYHITGVDQSPEMVDRANYINDKVNKGQQKPTFLIGDFFRIPIQTGTIDTIISLFHVVSYLNSSEQIISAFEESNRCLKAGGLFVFDYWHGPGVYNDPAISRTKKIKNEELEVIRTSYPTHKELLNQIEVNFEFKVQDLATSDFSSFEETHNMRYFFIPEIEVYASQNGFEVVDHLKWMAWEKPESSSWYVLSILRKK